MECARHLEIVRAEGARVAALPPDALGAPVPTMEGWTVERVVRHLAKVHRWVTATLALDDPAGPPADTRALAQVPKGPACLAAFERHSGQRVSRDDPAADIRRHLLTEWGDWKTRRIAEVAERLFDEIRRAAPGAMLGIKIVPWLESDLGGAIRHCVGQDFARLARNVDIVAPMAFTHILRRTPEWKARLLARVQQVTGKPVLSYVQAGAVYRPEPITAAEFSDELVTAVEGDHAGLAIFHYEQLVADPEKARILRTALLS